MIIIFTYQMVGLADQNGRTYVSKYGSYSKKDGFKITTLGDTNKFEDMLNNLMHDDLWSLKVEEKEMTKEEIEKALGYKIKIKDDKWNFDEYVQHGNDTFKKIHIPHNLITDDDIWSLLFK